ncbi:MAG: response regulator transcription factor [Ignavibacteriaceae bacterium]
MKILIADDNAKIRSLIIKLLADIREAEFIEARDGLEAIDCYKNNHPEIVLMDIMMERLDGIAALKKIKALPGNAFVIVISQLPESEYRAETISAGADGFLNKENLLQLPNIINNYLATI